MATLALYTCHQDHPSYLIYKVFLALHYPLALIWRVCSEAERLADLFLCVPGVAVDAGDQGGNTMSKISKQIFKHVQTSSKRQ